MNQPSDGAETPTDRIRAANIQLRTTGIGGKVLLTQGVNTLAEDVLHKVIQAITTFDDFTEDNDPHGEADFGSVVIDGVGELVFFKIDAYDVNYEYGSPDPADPEVTRRVMTILLASEY